MNRDAGFQERPTSTPRAWASWAFRKKLTRALREKPGTRRGRVDMSLVPDLSRSKHLGRTRRMPTNARFTSLRLAPLPAADIAAQAARLHLGWGPISPSPRLPATWWQQPVHFPGTDLIHGRIG